MLCKDLKVVNLSITEDHYEYKAVFRLCTDEACMDIDLARLSEPKVMEEIKSSFQIEESLEDMNKIIMEKVMEASKIESHIKEGQSDEQKTDKKTQRGIDSLSTS